MIRKAFATSLPFRLVKTRKQDLLPLHIQRVLKLYDINVVIDVGANAGQFAKGLRQTGYTGEIHSFEPVAGPFQVLQQAAADDPLWRTHRLALGAQPGEATINVSTEPVFSSLLPANAFGRARFTEMATSHEERIRIETLDAYLGERLAQPGVNALLKLDTQGFDLQVFEGAQRSLPSISCLLAEVAFISIYDGAPTYREALAKYEAAGFSASGLYPISRNADLSLIEMDCMLVNRSRLPEA